MRNPQYTSRNSRHNYNNPRNPHPLWYRTLRCTTPIKHTHLVHEIRSHKAPNNRIQSIERWRQETVQFSGECNVVLPGTSKRPRVLARAGYLGENEEHQYGIGAVVDQVPAREGDEERRQVVSDEEDVIWEEDDVVDKVH